MRRANTICGVTSLLAATKLILLTPASLAIPTTAVAAKIPAFLQSPSEAQRLASAPAANDSIPEARAWHLAETLSRCQLCAY